MRLPISLCVLLALAAFQAAANERLFDPPQEVFGRVSPDGNRLAVVAREDDGFAVDAIDFETSVRETFFATSSLGDGKFIVSAMSWVDNDTLALRIIEITEGIAKGEFRADVDARLAVLAILGMCNAVASWYRKENRTVKNIGEEFAALVIDGVGKRPPPRRR